MRCLPESSPTLKTEYPSPQFSLASLLRTPIYSLWGDLLASTGLTWCLATSIRSSQKNLILLLWGSSLHCDNNGSRVTQMILDKYWQLPVERSLRLPLRDLPIPSFSP